MSKLALYSVVVDRGRSRASEKGREAAQDRPGKNTVVFHITGEDHSGVVAGLLGKLAEKDIDVYAVQAVCTGNGRFGTLIRVNPDSVKKAAKILA